MYIPKLQNCSNTASLDDGPKSVRKYLGNNLSKIYQPIPTEYHKINMAIQKD